MLLIHSALMLRFLGYYILFQNCFVCLSFTCWYVSVYSPRYALVEFFFRSFWYALYFSALFILSRYIFSLPSFTCIVWFISLSCIVYFYLCCFFLCCLKIQRSSLVLSCLLVVKFLVCVSNRKSNPGFEFQFLFFIETPIFYRAILFLHKLVRLFPWCTLNNVFIIRLFFQVLFFLFSSLGFVNDGNLVFFRT